MTPTPKNDLTDMLQVRCWSENSSSGFLLLISFFLSLLGQILNQFLSQKQL